MIQRIDFIKIDVEGHEYKVLQGLSESFALDKIAIIQFEYSSFTNEIGDSLTKICELLLLNRFRIYRITPWGKIRIVNFLRNENRAGNYLAIKK